MRIYDIILFLFVFNLALATVKNLNIVGSGIGVNPGEICTSWSDAGICLSTVPATTWSERVQSKPSELSGSVTNIGISFEAVFSFLNAVYAFVFKGIPLFLDIFWSATVGVYWNMIAVGIPAALAVPLSAIVYFVYGIGLLQFMFQRSIKEYE